MNNIEHNYMSLFEEECIRWVNNSIYFPGISNRICLIGESRGIYLGVGEIIDIMVDNIRNENYEELTTNNITYKVFRMNNFSASSFIGGCIVVLHIKQGNDNRYIDFNTNSQTSYLINGKLCNTLFTAIMQTVDGKFNENIFRECMWHELHHAYRLYNVLLQNNNSISDAEAKNDEKNSVIMRQKTNSDLTQEKRKIYKMFYYFQNEEIDTVMTQIYPYLEEHTEINLGNFKNHISGMQGYKRVKSLQNYIESIYKKKNNKEFINSLLEVASDIFGRNCNFKRIMDYLNKQSMYATSKFYKVLYYSLQNLKRLVPEQNENGVFNRNDFLNKNNNL